MEKTYNWEQLSGQQQKMAVDTHAALLRIKKKEALLKIFQLGSPRIVLGVDEGQQPFCRLEEESAQVMDFLISQHLKP